MARRQAAAAAASTISAQAAANSKKGSSTGKKGKQTKEEDEMIDQADDAQAMDVDVEEEEEEDWEDEHDYDEEEGPKRRSKRGASSKKVGKSASSSTSSSSKFKSPEFVEDSGEEEDEEVDLENKSPNKNLYVILGVEATATTNEIKSAFKKLALSFHPDKQSGKSEKEMQESMVKFQDILKSYECLIDADRRKLYDATGRTSTSDADRFSDKEDGVSWSDYFDSIYTKLTADAIDEFEKVYRYGEEERRDVIDAYMKTKGSLLDMIDRIPLCTLEDLDRYHAICKAAISQGEVEEFRKFTEGYKDSDLAKRRTKAVKEAKMAEKESAKKLKGGKKEKEDVDPGMDALMATIQANQKKRQADAAALIDRLEEKALAQQQSKGKKKKAAAAAERTSA